jgi:predicted TIM-barrel fold metal-dependent hydrolase
MTVARARERRAQPRDSPADNDDAHPVTVLSAAVGSRVIDADGHVLEPLDRFPELNTTRDSIGLDHVYAGNQEIVTVSLGKLGTPGSNMADLAHSPRYENAQPGGFDPKVRLVDMDTEGIDAAVLFPSLGLNFWAIDDPDIAISLARAYNDWLAEYCAAAPTRLFGAAMVPWQSVDASVAELRRAHDELGFRAAFLRPNPCVGRTIAHPSHDAFWEAAEALDMTVGIHEGSSNTVATLAADRKPFNPLILHATSHAFEQMLACAQLIATGVLEHHPSLQFAFLEAGGGWAPYWLWRLDEQVEGFGGYCPEMKLAPSEYFARQCWVSFEIDEPSLPALLPIVGAERVIWGSDYPHHDATFPGAVDKLRRTIAPCTEADQARVLGTNALDCYRLELA